MNRRLNRVMGRNRNNLGLALLAFQIFQYGIDRIPIVTLVTLITNIGIYAQVPQLFDVKMPSVRNICISYDGIVEDREWIRLILSGVYHLSDMHLYYNMASFLYKGVKLEPKYGSVRFGVLLVVLQVLCSAVYVALQYIAAILMGPQQLHSCAAGFSCVLFALKVILQQDEPPSHSLMGVPIHMMYWSELFWISLISPNVSFVGHLAGIVAGLLVTRGPFSFVLTGETPEFFTGGLRGDRQRFSGGGVSTGTRQHNGGGDEDADVAEAIRRSMRDPFDPGNQNSQQSNNLYPNLPNQHSPQPSAPSAPSAPLYPDHSQMPSRGPEQMPQPHNPAQMPVPQTDMDELRRRRLQRFQ